MIESGTDQKTNSAMAKGMVMTICMCIQFNRPYATPANAVMPSANPQKNRLPSVARYFSVHTSVTAYMQHIYVTIFQLIVSRD